MFSFPRVIIKLVCPSRKPLKTTVDKMIHGCKPARPLKQCFFFCSKCKSQADGTKQDGLGEVGASHLLHDATRSRWKKTTLHRHCYLELATSKILKFKRWFAVDCGLWTLDCGYVRGSSVQLNCPALRNSWSHVPLITVASAGPLRNPGAARLQSIISARGPSTAASQVQFEWLPLSVRTTLQLQYQRAALVRNCCHLRQQDVFSQHNKQSDPTPTLEK